jgi:hypothetical protein
LLKGAKRAEKEETCNIALKKVKDSGRLNDWEVWKKDQSRLGLKRFFRPTETIREGSFKEAPLILAPNTFFVREGVIGFWTEKRKRFL